MKSTPQGIRFAATDLTTFVACEHATWLDGRVALGLLAEPATRPDPMLDLLSTRGQEHEKAYLEQLEASDAKVANIARRPDAVEATRHAMAEGADFIYQAEFEVDGWVGRADFLEKVDRPSNLGAWSYEVADTKLGRSAKAEYLLQLALYSGLLGDVQGVAPEAMHVILAGRLRESFKVAEYAAYVRAVRRRLAVAARLPEDEAPYPMPVEHCARCRWASACTDRWTREDHLSGVANIRRQQIRRLEAAGIKTMAALAATPPDLEGTRIRSETLATLVQQARLQVEQRTSGTPVYELLPPAPGRGFALLPKPADGDVFFDMEGDPLVDGGREYLFGWESRENGKWTYHALWGHDMQAEKKAFETFIDFLTGRLAAFPDMHVHHYAPYEPTALKRLAGRHGTREQALDDLLRADVFVDLFRVVRQALRAGFSGYSIKDLEPFYMGPRAADVKDAGSSIVAYEQWLESGDEALLESIRAYNAEDCASTRKLRDWLRKRATEAKQPAEPLAALPLFEPPPRDPVKAEAARLEKERQAEETAALTEGLLAGGDLLDAQARWLLAQLLEYHAREARPVWWAYFDRIRMLPDQLVEDTEAIGRLTPDDNVPPRPEKRSFVYTLRFPAQDFKKNALHDARDQDGNGAGDVMKVELDGEGGFVELKRGPSFKDKPLPNALIPGQPISTNAQRAALRRLARSVIAGDGKYGVLRALLRGDAPKVVGLAAGSPLQGDHVGVDEAWNVVQRLDQSALVIQGPPGSGKTYTAARLILRLMQAGKRVGITAPSHNVIHNVLHEVEKVAQEAKFEFRGVKKCDEGSEFVSKLDFSTIRNDDALKEMPADTHLVAGTSWLFAREGFDSALDVLFIDEAGQFALADALAVGTATTNLVLLGDPQQMPQVTQGTHPEGAAASVMEHVLREHDTIPPDRGLFLDESHRMHPDVCRFISELAYENRLESAEKCARQRVDSPGLAGTGLRFLPVEHEGNRQRSPEEAEVVAREIRTLLGGTWVDDQGATRELKPTDILVVAPYNAQVQELKRVVPEGVDVGTVDKFQGQQAPVVFYSMTTSSGEEAVRGIEFLFLRNRLNVAVSRAKALAVLVASPRLLQVSCKRPAEMRLVNGVARFVELGAANSLPAEVPAD